MTIDEWIEERRKDVVHPDVITEIFEVALKRVMTNEGDWWQDGRDKWHRAVACPTCGSPCPGICGPNFQPCAPEMPILRSEWNRRQEGK